MKLSALLCVLLTTTTGVRLLDNRPRVPDSYDRAELIRGYDQRVESSRAEWRRSPQAWKPAFQHARYLCKLREQRELQHSRANAAQAPEAAHELADELREAVDTALSFASTPDERRLTEILHFRAFGEAAPAPRQRLPNSTAAAGLAYW